MLRLFTWFMHLYTVYLVDHIGWSKTINCYGYGRSLPKEKGRMVLPRHWPFEICFKAVVLTHLLQKHKTYSNTNYFTITEERLSIYVRFVHLNRNDALEIIQTPILAYGYNRRPNRSNASKTKYKNYTVSHNLFFWYFIVLLQCTLNPRHRC